ncbi:MAG: ABC transporter substrate-binding protein [Candidatus Entotheonellia bacterium]
MYRKELSFVGLVALASLLLALLAFANAAEPKRGGTLRVAYGNMISHLDFHTAPGYEMMWVAMNIGCGLVNIAPDGHFVPDAAEAWEVAPDGKTYTFKLRDNVLFHDSTTLDAAAVKLSIDRLRDPATKSGMRRFYEAVDRVEVVDPRTVRVHMKKPYAFFLHMIAGYRTGLVLYSPTFLKQPDAIENMKKGKPGSVIGCGPFKFVEWVPGDHLVMDRWERYFQPGLPYLDRVVVRVIKDPISQMAALKAGEIDFIASFSPEHVHTLKAENPAAVNMTGKETTPMAAMMKVTVPCDGTPMSKERCPHPLFGDIRMRKAIACYGTNREEIVEIAFRGQATPWLGIIPPGTMDTVNVNHLCPYDPEKARAMLADLGYGPNHPLTFEIITDTEKSVFNAIATVIKEQMARIGVTANIKLVDKVTWLNTTLKDGPWDMDVEDRLSLLTLDSNAYLSVTGSSWNSSRHTDTAVDAYYERYAREMDGVKRKAIAREFQEYMADKLYWNTVSGSPFYQVAQPWMKGYTFNSEFEVHYETVWLEK